MAEQVAHSQSEAISTPSPSNATPEVNTAADLVRLRAEGRTLTTQELIELNTRVQALEEMARLEDRLHTLKSRKRINQVIKDLISQSGPFIPQLIP